MADVYEAEDERLQRRVALKLLANPESSLDPNAVERFEREARTVAGLDHEGIVPIYDIGQAQGQWFLAMRLLTGGDLVSRFGGTAIPPRQALDIVRRIASALAHVHVRGIVHRDIKPANILFDQEGQPILADFGIAKIHASTGITQTGATIGTVRYMSPEQARGYALTGKADVYSLGVMFYEMLCGAVPFKGESMAVLYQHCNEPPPPLPAPLKAFQPLMDGLLAKDPVDRPSAEQLVHLMDEHRAALSAGRPISQRTLQRVIEAPRPKRRRLGLLAGLSLLATAAAAGVWLSPLPLDGVREQASTLWSQLLTSRLPSLHSESSRPSAEREPEPIAPPQVPEVRSTVATAPPAEPRPTLDPLAPMLARFEQQMASSQLTMPQGDNATQNLAEMRQLAPADPRVAAAVFALSDRFVQAFGRALEAAEAGLAEKYLLLARQLTPTDAAVQQAAVELEAYRVAEAKRAERARAEAEAAAREAERQRLAAAAEAERKEEQRRVALTEAMVQEEARRQAAAQAEARAEAEERARQKALQQAAAEQRALAAERARQAQRLRDSVDTHLTGSTFRDCAVCPEMVVLPRGRFLMGSDEGSRREGPARWVDIDYPLAVGRYEITFFEWDMCRREKGCKENPDDEDWGRDRRPVMAVSREDVAQYLDWLNAKTGKRYRLLSEAEWEYAARAGSSSHYPSGDCLSIEQANFADLRSLPGCSVTGRFDRQTVPVGSYGPNAFGLHDMQGNVHEWTRDCWAKDYTGAPTNGFPVLAEDCEVGVVRGGSWKDDARNLRTRFRLAAKAGRRYAHVGFRVARQ